MPLRRRIRPDACLCWPVLATTAATALLRRGTWCTLATRCTCASRSSAASAYHLLRVCEDSHAPRCDRPLFVGLRAQLAQLGVSFVSAPTVLSAPLLGRYDVLLDALFGFSFSGSARPPFDALLAALAGGQTLPPLVSVDIPSGWSVNEGDVRGDGLRPDVLVSLTAPKLGVRGFTGIHFLGGRFVPPALRDRFNLRLPAYPGTAQCVRLPSSPQA